MGSTLDSAVASFPLWAALCLGIGVVMLRWHKARSEHDEEDDE